MLGAESPFWQLSGWEERLTDSPLAEVTDPDLGLALGESHDGLTLILYGEPARGVPALRDLVARGVRPEHTMMNREMYATLDEDTRDHYGPHWGYAWDFFWGREPLEPVEHSERVELLRAGSAQLAEVRDEVRTALEAANPITSAIDHFDELDWFVLRADDSHIATVMGASQGVGMRFEGLGTVPEYRGRGYGGATIVGAVNLSLELVDYVGLDVWAWNEGAMRLYRRLGIHHDARLINGGRVPFPDLRAQI